MSSLRAKRLGYSGCFLAGAFALFWDVAHLAAASQEGTAAVSGVSVIGLSGVAAMIGVGVLWGRMEATSKLHAEEIKRLRDVTAEHRQNIVPRSELDRRMEAIEEKIDRLLLQRPTP